MDSLYSRRSLTWGLALLGIAASIGSRTRDVAALQSNGIQSGGIGLSRSEWENIYGPGEATQSHGLYVEPTFGGPIYAGFDFSAFEDGLLEFLEFQWTNVSQSGGLSPEDTVARVSAALLADAQHRETYFMGATPGGPITLRSERWTSRELDMVTNGRASILVTCQEKPISFPGTDRPNATAVTVATIAVEQA
ncbi:MAG TPA: hypothetical protein VGR29_02890 [Thermomicrobiales bacterium]|nr:hypothetical protein [Thermomicrobiales bacterium]